MKTTLDIADPLFVRAKRVAARDGQTLRALVESALERELAARTAKVRPFKLRKVTFGSGGLQPGVAHLSMGEIIHLSYERDAG